MKIKFIDLFCGIGGFRISAEDIFENYAIESECVYSSDIDQFARNTYFANFGDYPKGDITEIKAIDIPDHDLLFAGFPCQPFSIIGEKRGFEDTRGTLFFEIARIIEEKKPKVFILENVKQLVTHSSGHTFKRIIETLEDLGYFVDYKILNALDFGLPQKRERVFIIGFYKPFLFRWPKNGHKQITLADILESKVDKKYYASEKIKNSRKERHNSNIFPSIWHENKSGNISSHHYSCALRAGASYNYLLVNGERRLTPREMLRLQGFPDWFEIVVSDAQIRKQAGNAVPIPVVKRIIEGFMPIMISDYKIKNDRKIMVKNGRGIEKIT
ncbi:MAG: DNA (cytosine-5-)-methyltransferase [Chloroflexi bacterium]|nr:DNA (cytosine-5-)-methyltransferase [Chloroflexota bacterium]